jgi:Rap guanine nucleotide exchange factor 1
MAHFELLPCHLLDGLRKTMMHFCVHDTSVVVTELESSTTPNTKPRGGKLARRARSFKEDFLEILSQMRSPGGGGGQRSASPHSPKTRTGHKVASIDTVDGAMEKNPLRDLDLHVKQVNITDLFSH